jgi:hypothetical protein
MKTELLNYSKKQKVKGKKHWRRELREATPEVGEKWDIYGMRLIEIAELAYPDDKKECAMQLRQRFLESSPPSVTAKIYDAERALKATSTSGRKRLSFDSLLQMARDLQQEQPKSVMWSGQKQSVLSNVENVAKAVAPPSFTRTQVYSSTCLLPQNGKEGETRQPTSSFTSQWQSGKATLNSKGVCSYCKNQNHSRIDCWKASKSCLICGKDHHIEQCPKYDPNYRTKSKSKEWKRTGN